jgi:peptidoglycan/LPS O-acetylase OafA/YrhL
MGSLGVDLFFVISGFLVGGLLVKDYQSNKKIIFSSFFLRRGFKIWPSYYVFLLIAGVFGYMLYRNTNPEQLPDSWWKYIFFYENYTNDPSKDVEWIYGHAWSLCVEEHFYILLPLIFTVVQRFGDIRWLTAAELILNFVGITSKVLTISLTDNNDTYFPTHNRIDALAWGVLLNIFISYSDWLKEFRYKIVAFFILLVIFFVCFKYYFMAEDFFKKVVFRSVVPILFAGMLGSLYYIVIPFTAPLRIFGYYSYNWYLWHPFISFAIMKNLGTGMQALCLYLVISFGAAILFTKLIEEPFLELRKRVFGRNERQRVVAA